MKGMARALDEVSRGEPDERPVGTLDPSRDRNGGIDAIDPSHLDVLVRVVAHFLAAASEHDTRADLRAQPRGGRQVDAGLVTGVLPEKRVRTVQAGSGLGPGVRSRLESIAARGGDDERSGDEGYPDPPHVY
jgi:hypothetical protein